MSNGWCDKGSPTTLIEDEAWRCEPLAKKRKRVGSTHCWVWWQWAESLVASPNRGVVLLTRGGVKMKKQAAREWFTDAGCLEELGSGLIKLMVLGSIAICKPKQVTDCCTWRKCSIWCRWELGCRPNANSSIIGNIENRLHLANKPN